MTNDIWNELYVLIINELCVSMRKAHSFIVNENDSQIIGFTAVAVSD